MGFMDKAKKLAEQAQQKLDEAQQNFNKGGSTPGQPGAGAGSTPGQPGAGAGPTYDQHGRPEESAPTPEPPAAEQPPASEQATHALDPNATPDPFKPLQQ
jgi:hypothetical protein